MNGREKNSGFYFIFISFFNNSGLFPLTAAGALLLSKVLILSFAMPSWMLFLQIFHGNTENIITVKRVNAFSQTRQMCHSNVPKISVACLIYR